ncbi:SDR family oxidoreductase [Streptosporangium sp. NBC_01755]|uniref:SDR family NAD(P)-dependent oxidoreductase n=1 Tax=unclassified Streptosporangium TaxID=2632669 RepID=UPI002DD9D4D2|nr:MULTISPECIES: SDR family NAD(P)-dependent oxidoreductase [unclassified Streptosporangium]WSA24631.1 SDR family oxidoreductase [Streptosporangium sp. NBC_01810]WSC97293.1 SDR family oxidoreductase [Streptosporangium sp. NBC_01755]
MIIEGVLSGRTALMVGTSPNIGAGIAIELARAGARVGCVDRDPHLAALTAKDIAEGGGAAHAVGCDATDPAAVTRAVDEVTESLGPIDLLVNGAVVYAVKGLLEMEFTQWRRQLAVMLDSAFLFSSLIAKRLVADGRSGAIVNLISTAGHQGEPGNIGYATAKGGLLNMTRSAATELAPHGIRVNSLTPTATDPAEAMARAQRWGVPGPDEATRAALALAERQLPLGALPSPSDYGRAAVFLCSDAARMITGIDLPVDAGSLARYWRAKPVEGP